VRHGFPETTDRLKKVELDWGRQPDRSEVSVSLRGVISIIDQSSVGSHCRLLRRREDWVIRVAGLEQPQLVEWPNVDRPTVLDRPLCS
jgi:hypothetical protein